MFTHRVNAAVTRRQFGLAAAPQRVDGCKCNLQHLSGTSHRRGRATHALEVTCGSARGLGSRPSVTVTQIVTECHGPRHLGVQKISYELAAGQR